MKLCSLQNTSEIIPLDAHSQVGWQLNSTELSKVTADLPVIKSKVVLSVLGPSRLFTAFETDDQPVCS